MPIINATLVTTVEVEGETSSSSDRPPVASWVYPDLEQEPSLSIIHPKPPHYHDSLSHVLGVGRDLDSFDRFSEQWRSEAGGEEDDEVELNVDLLVGAKAAEDSLKSYEIDVGFYYAKPESAFHLQDRSLCKTITDDHIAVGKQRWRDLAENLTGGLISLHSRSRRDSGGQDLGSPTSSEFFDLTDSEHSEHSVDSDPVPSTPKPRPYTNVTIKQSSPSLQDFSPPRALNASASSFIPTTPNKIPSMHFPSFRFSHPVPSPSPSPTYSNFTFPSLNTSIQSLPSLPPTLKKDEQGFYTEVSSPSTDHKSVSQRAQRSSQSLLPPFLADLSCRARKTSNTRKIIDQLRSASANGADRPNSRSCVPVRPVSTPQQLPLLGPSLLAADADPSRLDSDASISPLGSTIQDFEEDGDGWLRVEVEDTDSDPEAKTRRTRDLMHALGRNRPGSTHGSDSDVNHRDTDWEVFSQPTHKPKKLSKEASSTRRKGSRHRSRKSHGGYRGSSVTSPAAPPPVALPLPPTQPFFPAYAVYNTPYAYTAPPYKSMIPTQTHCFQAQTTYASTPFGPITLYPPVIQLAPSSASSMNMYRAFDRSSIAGGTGMTHAQW